MFRMVSAVRDSAIHKRFISDIFAPPANFRASNALPGEVTVAEILQGGVRESDWSFPVVLSTSSEDRVGDRVIPEGCDYTAFAQSPSVFFDHQSFPFPIGTLRSPHDGRLYLAIVPGKAIIGRVWIYQPAESEQGEHAEVCRTIWALIKAGLLNGVSVGFDPIGEVKPLPSGGNLYKSFEILELSIVGLPANPQCGVIRDPAILPAGIAKRLHPVIQKSLSSWYPEKELSMFTATVEKAKGTHDIQQRDGKWVILDNKTRKVLSHHDSKAEAEAAMRALQFHKHEGKSLSESSGTDGGYTVGDKDKDDDKKDEKVEKSVEKHAADGDPDDDKDEKVEKSASELPKASLEEIHKRFGDHADYTKGHELHFNEETGGLRHYHPGEAKPEHVKAIGDDLGSVVGIKSLEQHVIPSQDAPTIESGFKKVYPVAEEKSKYQEGGGTEASSLPPRKKSLSPECLRRAALHEERGRHLERMLVKGMFTPSVHRSIEDCVQRKVPKLIEEGYEQEQAVAIAFSMCGEKKGVLPPITKTFAAAVAKAYDESVITKAIGNDAESPAAEQAFSENYDTNFEDPAAASRPGGLVMFQTAIDFFEGELDRQEPELQEIVEKVIDLLRDEAEERYPGEDFGGADDAGKEEAAADGKELTTTQAANANDAAEQAKTNAMLYRYKRHRPGVKRGFKRPAVAKKRSSPFNDNHAELLKSIANHLHEIGDMDAAETNKGCHLKGYTMAHHRRTRVMGRAADRIHGAVTKEIEQPGQMGDDKETASGRRGKKEVEKSLSTEQAQKLQERLNQSDTILADLYRRATGKELNEVAVETAISSSPGNGQDNGWKR